MNRTNIKSFLMLLTVFAVSRASCAIAQDDSKSPATADTSNAITQMIADLDGGFQSRVKALKDLERAGAAAIEPLRKALPNASLQARQDIERLLKVLESRSILGRVKKLETTLAAADAKGLPEWDRYRKFVGDDERSLRFYVRLLKAEPDLFGEADKTDRESARRLSSMLETTASELVRKTEPRRKFDTVSYAALLLIGSNNDRQLRGKSSYNISAMLLDPAFLSALKSSEGPILQSLAGEYILRGYINPETPLLFAQKHPLSHGLRLARLTLQKKFRGHNGIHAMRIIREQGEKADIALLEGLFSNQTVFFTSQTGQLFTVTNGDVALASAIVMRKQDPRDFGFAPKDNRKEKFRFVVGTTGFSSPEDRDATRERYYSAFSDAKK